MLKSLNESLRGITPTKDVVEALTAELLSTAQELLAIAEPSPDAPNLEEGDDIMFEHLLSADERRDFDEYSETIRELKQYCKENKMDFEKILDDILNKAIIYEDVEKLTDESMEKIGEKRSSKGNTSKLRNYIKNEIGKNLVEKFLKEKNIADSFDDSRKGKKESGVSSNNKANNNDGEGKNQEGSIAGSFGGGSKGKKESGVSSNNKANNNDGEGTNQEGNIAGSFGGGSKGKKESGVSSNNKANNNDGEGTNQEGSIAGSFGGGSKGKKESGVPSNKKANNNDGEGTNEEGQKLTEDEKKLINSLIEKYSEIRNSTYFNKKSFYRNVIEKTIENIEKNSGNSENQAKEGKNKISQDELLKDFENFCRDVISKLIEKEKNQSNYYSKFFPEDLIHKNFSKDCPLGDIVIDDEEPVSESFRGAMEEVEEQIAKITGESTRTQGTTPGGEETILNARFGIHSRIRQIFRSLRSQIEGTTSSKLTSREERYKIPPISALGRVSGIPLPGREPIASYSVLVLDTSGSINEDDLSRYAIPSICSLFASNSTHIIIIQYDADLQRECLIEPGQRHNLMKALESYKGRGGTAMENALLYVYEKFIERKTNKKIKFKELKDKISYSKVNTFLKQNRKQPDKVVMITDGVTGYDAPGLEGWLKIPIPLLILRFYEHGNWPEKIPHYRVDMSNLANITYSYYDPRGQAMSL